MWLYPDGSRILEVSTKCLPKEAFQAAAEFKAYLASRGIALSADQAPKTKTALEFFSARLTGASIRMTAETSASPYGETADEHPHPESGDGLLRDPPDFSLVLGGPLFQLLRRAHLSDDALLLVRQRILVIALLAWLPLLVLSALEGQVLGGDRLYPSCSTWRFTSVSWWPCPC